MKNIINMIKNNKYIKIGTTILSIIVSLYCAKLIIHLTGGIIGSLFLYVFTQRIDVFLFGLGLYIMLFLIIILCTIYIIIINTKQ